MALAPTLLTFRNIAAGVGTVALVGLAVTVETGVRGPAQGTISVGGLAPSIAVQLGPTADADVGELIIEGREPFLLRTLVIAPGLPDAEPESNDLTPTMLWQEIAQPATAVVTMAGLAPAVVADTGQSIAISPGLIVINGLAPTLDVPAGQAGIALPIVGAAAFTALEPTLLLELAIECATPDLVQLVGFAPTLSAQVGWTDVPVVSAPSWDDVPTV